MRNKTTNIYTEWLPLIESLPNEIAGVIFKNILKYQNGEDINNDFPIWLFIKTKIDEYNTKKEEISEKRKKSGSYGGKANASKCYQMLPNDAKCSNKIKENKIKENNIKEKTIKNPPTLDEINQYIKEKNLNVDGKKFFDYYSEGGWKDRDGKPIRNWKQKMLVVWDKPKQKEQIKEFW